MSDVKRHVKQLRERANMCRVVAGIPANGGHETDRILLNMAERLEREADELEAASPAGGVP